MAKRICTKNIGESFHVQIEGQSSGMNVILLKCDGTQDWDTATFTDPYFPGGEWGQWKVTRFKSKWYAHNGSKRLTVIN